MLGLCRLYSIAGASVLGEYPVDGILPSLEGYLPAPCTEGAYLGISVPVVFEEEGILELLSVAIFLPAEGFVLGEFSTVPISGFLAPGTGPTEPPPLLGP